MEFLIMVLCWTALGYVGYKIAENLNHTHDTNFDPRIWATIGFIFGIWGLAGLGLYAWFTMTKKGDK